ncbi:MAG TPA: TonB-dependent receptor [Bryobacterales bacterium]|jgi:hypothetical protein|nr:TonB-dependent receptor [Bryobacterales bacterium]
MRFLKIMNLVLVVLLWGLPAWAQIDTGTITGTVTDPTGAVVPKAVVTATNEATNVSTTTQTNSQGQYVLSGLKVGTYSVSAELAGFRKIVRTGLELHVQERLAVDLALQVGEVTQAVEVSAGTPVLETQSADMGNVVEQRRVVDLPLNGRHYEDLALLAPGVFPRPGTGNPSPARFNVNGNFSLHNYFALDGVDNNTAGEGLFGGSPQIIQPPPDAIQEFKVQTRTYSAEFGTAQGAVINAALKSGTNQLHGDLYHFLRNSALDANDFFANTAGIKKGNFVRNEGGFTVGGPVYLPGVYDGRDKTFFFSDFSFLRIRKAQTLAATVPTPAMKKGDFSGLASLKDPSSVIPSEGGCIVNNVIQQRCIDPVGLAYANLYPDPTVPGPFTGQANYFANASVPTNSNLVDAKIDERASDKDSMFVRYSYYKPVALVEVGPFTAVNPLSTGGFTANNPVTSQQAATSWTHVFSPTLVNEARFSFSRRNAAETPFSPPGSAADKVGLKNVPNTPLSSGIPAMNVGGFPKLGTSEWRPQFQVSQVWQALDNLSMVKGKHSFKYGFEWKRYTQNTLDIRAPQGAMTVDNNLYVGASGTSSFAGLANLLLGNVTTFNLSSPFVYHDYMNGTNFYAQDTWRLTSTFTLNYGVRYEYFTPWIERDNHTSNFDSANGGRVILASNGGVFQRALVNPDKNNFAPRVGFAYNPTKRVVVRGGFGVFYQAYDVVGSESVVQLNPPQFIDTAIGVGPTQPPVFFLRNGYPTLSPPSITDPKFLTQIQFRAMDQNMRSPYVEQASLGVQFDLGHDTVFELSGVGNYAHKVRKLRNLNQGILTTYGNPASVVFPYQPTFGNGFIEYLAANGDTNFHALEMRVEKKYSNGLSFLASYTWSKSLGDVLDNLSAGFSGGVQVFPQNAYNNRADYGPSAFDQRHRFVLSYVYELPWGKGKHWLNGPGPVTYALGNWQINGITTFSTGAALTATAPASLSGTAPNGGANARANCLSPVTTGGPLNAWFSKSSFGIPAAGTFGTCGPNTFYGPGLNNWDFSAFKKFPVTESKYFEFRSEFFNLWNHPQFAPPNTSVTSGGFGQITSLQVPTREIQMALKFYF